LHVAALRWPDGKIVCPKCQVAEGERKHYWLDAQKRWKCYVCRRQFSVKVGTIFEDSPLGLDVWLTALWMLCNCKNGVSSYEIARAMGIAQKSAWFVLQRLRMVLRTKPVEKIVRSSGPAEIDETHVGGTPRFMHAKRRNALKMATRGHSAKTAVMGILDREARQVRAEVVPNVRRETLQEHILTNIEGGAKVYTDNAVWYDKALQEYVHKVVDHTQEYVRGEVHTNGIENFWSLLKRTLKGTYVAVEPFHLDRYVGEQVFRFNNRATKDNPLDDADRFMLALSQVAGKRLTWVDLTGKESPKPF
jgi:transposase-like protein